MTKVAHFSFVVPDDNMSPFVFEGDTIIVQRTRKVREGAMVIVSLRDCRERLVGLLRRRGDEFVLQRTRWMNMSLGKSDFFDIEGRVVKVEAGGPGRDSFIKREKREPETSVGRPFRISLAIARKFELKHNEVEELSPAIPYGSAVSLMKTDLPRVEHPSQLPDPKPGPPLLREVQLDRRRLSSRTKGASRMFQALSPLEDIGRPKGEILITRQPRRIEAGMMLVCKLNRQHIVRYVGLDNRLRVYLETRSTRLAPVYLAPSDNIEVLGEVIEQQLDM